MLGTFQELTVGAVGKFSFRVLEIDPVALTASLEMLSNGQSLGTADINLATNSATIQFTAPLTAAQVDIESQAFEVNDIIHNVRDGRDYVCHGMSGSDVLTAVVGGVATGAMPSAEFVKVGVAVMAG